MNYSHRFTVHPIHTNSASDLLIWTIDLMPNVNGGWPGMDLKLLVIQSLVLFWTFGACVSIYWSKIKWLKSSVRFWGCLLSISSIRLMVWNLDHWTTSLTCCVLCSMIFFTFWSVSDQYSSPVDTFLDWFSVPDSKTSCTMADIK